MLESRLIGQRIREARLQSSLTQTELGKKMGLDQSSVSDLERGVTKLGASDLVQFSRILGRSVEHFLGLDNGLAEDEDALLATYRSIRSPEIRELVRDVLKDQARLDARLTARFGEIE